MERLLLSSALALSAFSAQATELEVSFAYSDAYASDSYVLVSSEIVGFYRSLEAVNSLLEESGAELTLVPAKVFDIDNSLFPEVPHVRAVQGSLWLSELKEPTNDSGHMLIALSKIPSTNRILGASVPFSASGYKKFDDFGESSVNTKKATIVSGITNTTAMVHGKYLILHELLHSLGAGHNFERAKSFDIFDTGETYGHGEICDDGFKSVMETPWDNDNPRLKLSGTSGCDSGNGDMVRFINTYAPKAAQHEPYLNMATLEMDVVEDTTLGMFDFTVTRTKSTDELSLAYIHLSNTNPIVGNEIKPIEVSFAPDQLSATVSVPFALIHPLFDDAQYADGMVYAVAVSENEVQKSLIDLTEINTAWVKEDDDDNSGDDSSDNGDGGDDSSDNDGSAGGGSSGGSGGGTFGGFGVALLGLIGLFRSRSKWFK